MKPNFVSQIERQINKEGNKSHKYARIVYFFMIELNQPLSEIMEMPLPLGMELLKVAEEEAKKMEKKMNKGKKNGKH